MTVRPSLYLFITFLLIICLAGCSGMKVRSEAEHVRFHFVEVDQPLEGLAENCTFIDEIVGSDGRWYTYLFISNSGLTHGALNDMKNNALDMGADTVLVHQRLYFTTSVTFLGQAYRCGN